VAAVSLSWRLIGQAMLRDLMTKALKQFSVMGATVYIFKKDALTLPLGESQEMSDTAMVLMRSGTFTIQTEESTQYLKPFDVVIFPKGSCFIEMGAEEKLKFYLILFPARNVHFMQWQSFAALWGKSVSKISLDQSDYLVLSLICRLLYAEGKNQLFNDFDIELRRISSNLLLFELKLIYAKYFPSDTLYVSRTEKVASQFLTVLSIHCKKHHAVKFYAGVLYVTSVYLNRAVKEVTGKTAKKLIAEAVLAEAVSLLEDPQFSIAEIAEELEFSSLSAFDVFFKNLMSCTPSEFRSNAIERFKSR